MNRVALMMLGITAATALGCSATGLLVDIGTGGTSASTGGASSMAATGGVSYKPIPAATGGVSWATGGTTYQVTKATGGAATQPAYCRNQMPPMATGTLSVAAGYVTAGILKGYGFTWVGNESNASACITPACDTTGCTPGFGATALCGAGAVGADSSYNSVVGIGFNLNQSSSGNDPGSVSAPTLVTVNATLGGGSGDAAARVQLVDTTGTAYCVNTWISGSPILITSFNSACWDGSGISLSPRTPIVSINIVVPSDSTTYRSFGICLTGVTFG